MFNRPSGVKLINDVFKQFNTQRDILEKGIALCVEERDENLEEITALKFEAEKLQESIVKAEKLVNSINKMME